MIHLLPLSSSAKHLHFVILIFSSLQAHTSWVVPDVLENASPDLLAAYDISANKIGRNDKVVYSHVNLRLCTS